MMQEEEDEEEERRTKWKHRKLERVDPHAP